MFVGLKIITIFAACSNMNERPKIRKMTENNEFLQLKNMNDNELKEWQVCRALDSHLGFNSPHSTNKYNVKTSEI